MGHTMHTAHDRYILKITILDEYEQYSTIGIRQK